uniref:GINS subunit domain-containing protein n=1 Tax=Salix viminalis TaxID=40686 RepID=A0A6N2N030_SALVM
MYARKGYELVKDLANGEKGQLQPFNVRRFVISCQCTQHYLELQALIRHNRAEVIQNFAWKVGLELLELPEEIQEKLSPSEKNYFGKHSSALQSSCKA